MAKSQNLKNKRHKIGEMDHLQYMERTAVTTLELKPGQSIAFFSLSGERARWAARVFCCSVPFLERVQERACIDRGVINKF